MENLEIIEIISALVAVIIGVLVSVYSMLIRNSTKKNSNHSEKILFELKQVNDEVNNKIREFLLNSSTYTNKENKNNNIYKVKLSNDVINQENDKKLDELIHNHHSQAISQSKIQFWFSLIAAVIGFIFIIITVCFASNNVWYEYIVRVLPGAIIEAVSILFFSQSRETRERSSDFLNRLREDKQYEKGIAIAETISDEQLKSTLKAKIALRLCGINDINMFQNESNNKE